MCKGVNLPCIITMCQEVGGLCVEGVGGRKKPRGQCNVSYVCCVLFDRHIKCMLLLCVGVCVCVRLYTYMHNDRDRECRGVGTGCCEWQERQVCKLCICDLVWYYESVCVRACVRAYIF